MINIIAEIGINHNGSVGIAKKIIDVAKVAGCNFVKFQKRTPDLCVPEAQKSKRRQTPWGEMSYLEYKKRIEFEESEFDEIASHCDKSDMGWFASVWDRPSIDFMVKYTDIGKIPSALITDHELLRYARQKFKTLMISTGMSTEEEIQDAVTVSRPDIIFHTNSSYPSKIEELNLNYIQYLKSKYLNTQVGYSGHEFGLATTFATVPMGVSWIERHVTLDRTMWGSDQMASVEPHGLIKLVKGVRNIETALGPEHQSRRILFGSELAKRESLRGPS